MGTFGFLTAFCTSLTWKMSLSQPTEGTIGKFSQCKIGGLAFISSQSFRIAHVLRSTPKPCQNNLLVGFGSCVGLRLWSGVGLVGVFGSPVFFKWA